MSRFDSRQPTDLRTVSLEPGYYDYAAGSCLVKFGNTHVLCAATVESSVPPHVKGSGALWVTAEYNMLPVASGERIRRERNSVGGRTQEIQRLIGRALRSVIKLEGLGERSITIDCDVLRADGGTRTASITGAFVCLVQALRKMKQDGKIPASAQFPIKDYLSAISVGMVSGRAVLDLNYVEDSKAETDMNIVMTGSGQLVEIQGTAEKEPFSQGQLQEMLALGLKGCQELAEHQKKILGNLGW